MFFYFFFRNKISDKAAEQFSVHLTKLTNLKNLTLNFSANEIKEMSAIYVAEGLSKLEGLKKFTYSLYS